MHATQPEIPSFELFFSLSKRKEEKRDTKAGLWLNFLLHISSEKLLLVSLMTLSVKLEHEITGFNLWF